MFYSQMMCLLSFFCTNYHKFVSSGGPLENIWPRTALIIYHKEKMEKEDLCGSGVTRSVGARAFFGLLIESAIP